MCGRRPLLPWSNSDWTQTASTTPALLRAKATAKAEKSWTQKQEPLPRSCTVHHPSALNATVAEPAVPAIVLSSLYFRTISLA